jgi:HD-like signal output (HDOD) protein
MDKKQTADILDKIRGGYSLPSLSALATKLIELASADNAIVPELAALIEKDPALTVRLLRLANSAFFNTGQEVTSIRQAIFRIGFNRLRIMALSLSLRDTFPMAKHGPMDYEKFWRVSLYKAIAAKSLADKLRNCNPDEAFIAGLIQEIGLLIFYDLIIKGSDTQPAIELYPLERLLASEHELFGITHREIGEAALRYWKFPEAIIACQQNIPAQIKTPDLSPLCLDCEIARELSSLICQESMEFSNTFKEISEKYGIDHEATSDILVNTFNEVENIAASLNVELDKGKDLFQIVEKANRTLGMLSEQMMHAQNSSPGAALPSFNTLQNVRDQAAVTHTLQAVAHEIRNPLTSVSGFVQKLSSIMDSSSEGWDYVQIILKESGKLEQALSHMTQKV